MAELKIKILNWNAAGAKFLEHKEAERAAFRTRLNERLQYLAAEYGPDLMLLQEVALYGQTSHAESLIEPPPGYFFKPSIAIDTERQTHPGKWKRYRERGGWPPDAYLAQGCGILWRQEIDHSEIWDFQAGQGQNLPVEEVRLDTGLYTGDRDTEPRLAVVTHFVFHAEEIPLDVFVVNLHLTTLKGEREGIPERDDMGSRIRLAQIETVLHGVVSRYNQWRTRLDATGRAPAVWVLAGDLNCTPESLEVAKIRRVNFIDLNPDKGSGTKARGLGSEPTIAVDYIFAGPEYVALNPYITAQRIKNNPKPLSRITLSDHVPLFAELPILIPVPG